VSQLYDYHGGAAPMSSSRSDAGIGYADTDKRDSKKSDRGVATDLPHRNL